MTLHETWPGFDAPIGSAPLLPVPSEDEAPQARASNVPLAVAERVADARTRVRLAGPLPLDCLRRIAHGCAAWRVSIAAGIVSRSRAGYWSGRLDLEAQDAIPDILDLACGPEPAPLTSPPPILDFAIEVDAGVRGALSLEVHAWESVGLLAGVLDVAAGVGLAPIGVALETEGDCAFHLANLCRIDQRPAGPRDVRRLTRALASRAGSG